MYGVDFKLSETESETAQSQPPSVNTGVVVAAVEEGFRGALEKLDKAPSASQGSAGPSSQVLRRFPSDGWNKHLHMQ